MPGKNKKKNKAIVLDNRKKIPVVDADYRSGLTRAEVSERMSNGWNNAEVDSSSRTVREIIVGNLCTYFNLIFLILTILLIIVRSYRNLTFLAVIISNVAIGIIQEIRSKRTLDKMSMLAAPKVKVVREGKIWTVPSRQLVRDDIVQFTAGNQICADAVVVEGEVQVNESLLTGETDEITKKPGDKLISGSYIVSGKCYSRLTGVGRDSYISKLSLEAKTMSTDEQSEIMRSLNKLLKVVGIILIPIAIILFVQGYYLNSETFADSITAMVAAVIGMIPEGIYLLTTIAMAVSAIRLSQKGVLLHDMKSIETLARVDVLCLDKTGTITENTMNVKEVIPLDGNDEKKVSQLLGDFASVMSSDNITMEALKEYYKDHRGRSAKKVISFSSRVKYSGAVFSEGAYVLGAPEFVLREKFDARKNEIGEYTSKGYRLLVFASYDGIPDGNMLNGAAHPLAYVLLANPIRKEAPATFAYFAEQGVDIKIISGDTPKTVSEVARQANVKDWDKYVDASTLKTDADVSRAMKEYAIFGRVTPDQKRQFIRALKAQGRTVAMTGDGVNDVLALKDADCSVAMASGSDAAAQASQVVLLDSDFSCMPSVVLEGRRVVNNIQRSASLYLVKNIFSFLLSMFAVFSMITYPLEPAQVSLISTFTITIPAFFLALEPNKEKIEGRFLANIFLKALPAGITDALIAGAMVIFGRTFGVGTTDVSVAATMLLAIVGFMILFKICRPISKFRGGIWIFSVALCIAAILVIPEFFGISAMSMECVMLFVVFGVATEPVLRYLTMLVTRINQWWRRMRVRRVRRS